METQPPPSLASTHIYHHVALSRDGAMNGVLPSAATNLPVLPFC